MTKQTFREGDNLVENVQLQNRERSGKHINKKKYIEIIEMITQKKINIKEYRRVSEVVVKVFGCESVVHSKKTFGWLEFGFEYRENKL